jgi:hypothetical protein
MDEVRGELMEHEQPAEVGARVGFDEGARAVVEQDGWRSWRTVEEIRWRSADGREIVVPPGTDTDFASVPRPFVWFLPRYGRWTKPSIVHDHLWRTLSPSGEVHWRDADRYFREAMAHTQVPLLRRWMMWAAVRWAALLKPDGWRGWWRDLPAMLLFTLIGLVFVLPPAVLIVPALLLFQVFEWLVYGVGRLFRRREVSPGLDMKSG